MSIKAKSKILSENKKIRCNFSIRLFEIHKCINSFYLKKRKTINDELITVENKQYKQKIVSN